MRVFADGRRSRGATDREDRVFGRDDEHLLIAPSMMGGMRAKMKGGILKELKQY